LLQDSLGGNTRTCLIATVAPIIDSVDETSNTLKFAERAQHIITVVKQNKINAVDQDLVLKLQMEIKYLKDILNMRRKGTSVNEVHHKLLLLQEENDRLRKAISIQEVENLIEENKKMKLELQALRNSTQAVNQLVDEGMH
jgi:kinesin family member 11